MLRRLASVVACIVACALIGPANAHAATREFIDGPGDVWTFVEDPPKRVPDREQGDILRTTLQHRQQQIVVRTKFAELNRVGRRIFVFTQLRTNTGLTGVFELRAGPHNNWRGRVAISRSDRQTVDCATSHQIDYAANTAVVQISRGCLDDPRTVQAKFGVLTVAGGKAFADNPINHRDSDNLPPYTAPVTVG